MDARKMIIAYILLFVLCSQTDHQSQNVEIIHFPYHVVVDKGCNYSGCGHSKVDEQMRFALRRTIWRERPLFEVII